MFLILGLCVALLPAALCRRLEESGLFPESHEDSDLQLTHRKLADLVLPLIKSELAVERGPKKLAQIAPIVNSKSKESTSGWSRVKSKKKQFIEITPVRNKGQWGRPLAYILAPAPSGKTTKYRRRKNKTSAEFGKRNYEKLFDKKTRAQFNNSDDTDKTKQDVKVVFDKNDYYSGHEKGNNSPHSEKNNNEHHYKYKSVEELQKANPSDDLIPLIEASELLDDISDSLPEQPLIENSGESGALDSESKQDQSISNENMNINESGEDTSDDGEHRSESEEYIHTRDYKSESSEEGSESREATNENEYLKGSQDTLDKQDNFSISDDSLSVDNSDEELNKQSQHQVNDESYYKNILNTIKSEINDGSLKFTEDINPKVHDTNLNDQSHNKPIHNKPMDVNLKELQVEDDDKLETDNFEKHNDHKLAHKQENETNISNLHKNVNHESHHDEVKSDKTKINEVKDIIQQVLKHNVLNDDHNTVVEGKHNDYEPPSYQKKKIAENSNEIHNDNRYPEYIDSDELTQNENDTGVTRKYNTGRIWDKPDEKLTGNREYDVLEFIQNERRNGESLRNKSEINGQDTTNVVYENTGNENILPTANDQVKSNAKLVDKLLQYEPVDEIKRNCLFYCDQNIANELNVDGNKYASVDLSKDGPVAINSDGQMHFTIHNNDETTTIKHLNQGKSDSRKKFKPKTSETLCESSPHGCPPVNHKDASSEHKFYSLSFVFNK